MEAETVESPKQRIERVAGELKLRMTAVFVPWSQSRNAGEKYPSLNWKVALSKIRGIDGEARKFLETDYMAGAGHCPSYRQHEDKDSLVKVEWECENGRAAGRVDYHGRDYTVQAKHPKQELKPELADVVSSLVLDSDVLDRDSFEEWAVDCGYDVDSRKAEKIYRDCLNIALKMRNALGEDGLAKLREACQDY